MLYCMNENHHNQRLLEHNRQHMIRNFLSLPRKRESSDFKLVLIPAFAGMTFSRPAFIIVIIAAALFLHGCCLQCLTDEGYARKQREEHEAQYAPFKQQNTVEGYREFIKQYPKNMFVGNARELIATIEFTPYETVDTMEGYMEFVIQYPENPNVSRALARIEQMEFKRYESMDTIEGYKEFLEKYPKNIYSMLAKDRLQDLEVRAFDEVTRKQYGFDLLLYRLQAKKMQDHASSDEGMPSGDFSIFASIDTNQGKKYFHTHVIYADALSSLDAASPQVREKFFHKVIVKLIAYLDAKFAGKKEIDGFSFDIASSPSRFYGDKTSLLEYYFSAQDARLFAGSRLDEAQLLANATVVIPERPKPAPAPLVKMNGNEIMAKVCGRDIGRDSLITRTWQLVLKNGTANTMNTVEKWKSFAGADGVRDKSVIRYMIGYGGGAGKKQAAAILTVSYTQKPKAFWYIMYRGDAGITTYIDNYRPLAELDFPLADYVEIGSTEEKHTLLRDEEYENARCFVVESTPIQAHICYGKRVSWIDTANWIPLKIDYFDKKGALWKTLHITWQSRFGRWYWEKAEVENVQTGDKTVITTKDVRVNVGLPDTDFTPYALQRLTGK